VPTHCSDWAATFRRATFVLYAIARAVSALHVLGGAQKKAPFGAGIRTVYGRHVKDVTSVTGTVVRPALWCGIMLISTPFHVQCGSQFEAICTTRKNCRGSSTINTNCKHLQNKFTVGSVRCYGCSSGRSHFAGGPAQF
jgi:hypothetical protein